MNDRYFDEVIRVKLEAMMDASAVDEAALEEVLDVADQLNVGGNVDSNSWWSQWSSGVNGNIWWFGSISGLMIAGVCWWVLQGTEPPPPAPLTQQTVQLVSSSLEEAPPEKEEEREEKREGEQLVSSPFIPDSIPQYEESESVPTVDSLPVFQKLEGKEKAPLPMIKLLQKMPRLSIADIKQIPLKPVILKPILSPQKKSNTEPPTYHSPSHPNRKRTSTTRPQTYILKRR